MHTPNWVKNTVLAYLTIFRLLIHPYRTIRNLCMRQGSDVLIYVLAIPIIPIVLTLHFTLLEQPDLISTDDIKPFQIFILAAIFLALLYFLSYWVWRFYCYCISTILKWLGGTCNIDTLSIGLLHFQCIYTLVKSIVFIHIFIHLLLGTSIQEYMASSHASVVPLAVYKILPWLAYLVIRFIKESSDTTYVKACTAWSIPASVLFLIVWVSPKIVENVIQYPILSWFL